MAFQCGFFNSINGDRKYTAEQMNNPYKGIVSNGVLAKENDSNGFQVQELSLLRILIKEGYGIFADKWAVLDADLILDVPTPHVNYARIDSVIVRVDTSDDVRAGSIEYVQGTAAQNPVQPTLTRTDAIKEYRLANITVPANAISITQANIEDTRPSAECGFVTNLLQNSDISATYAQWQAQFEEWLANNNAWAETKQAEHETFIATEQAEYNEWTDAKRNEFENWFNNLTETLNVNTALQSYSSHYETTEENETVIPIGIFDYSSNLDVLKVYINGLMLIPLIDYTINDFSSITLIKPVDKGTIVAFNVIKSIIAPLEVEEVTYQVQRINSVIPAECGETNPLADKKFVNKAITVKNFFKTNATRMIAHRGRSDIAPENTIPAYELAGDYGYWGGEVDVQKTKDGHFICIHDGTIDRTTNGTGSVANMTLAEIQELYIKAQTPFMGNTEVYPIVGGEAVVRVPTLEQYLEACKNCHIVPVIELKEETLSASDMSSLLEIINKWQMTEQVIFIGFNDLNTNLLETLHSLNPKVHCQPILDFTKENIDYVAKTFAPNSGIDPAYGQITKELVDYAHSKGVEVNCWTCDDDTEKERLMECGVDYITTNSLINSKLPEMKTGALNYELGGVDRVVDIIQKSFELQAEASPNLIYCKNPVIGNHNIYDWSVNNDEGYFATPYSRVILSSNQLKGDEKYILKRAIDKTKYYLNEKTIYLGGLDFTKYKMTLLPFDEKGLFIADMGWFTSNCFVALPDNTSFVLFYFATTDGDTAITAEDLENFKKAYIGRNGNRRYIRLTDGDFCFVTKLNDNLASLGKTELQLSDMTAGFLSAQPTDYCWCFKPINTVGDYPKVKVHYNSSDYIATVYAFKKSYGKLVYTENLGWAEDGVEITLTSGTERIYLAFKKSDDTVLSQVDFINIANSVMVEIY